MRYEFYVTGPFIIACTTVYLGHLIKPDLVSNQRRGDNEPIMTKIIFP